MSIARCVVADVESDMREIPPSRCIGDLAEKTADAHGIRTKKLAIRMFNRPITHLTQSY